MNCTDYGTDGFKAPFVFYSFGYDGHKNGPVAAVLHNASGLCWYPSATCGPGQVPDGEACCELSEYGLSRPIRSWLLPVIIVVLMVVYVSKRCRDCRKQFAARGLERWQRDYYAMEQKGREMSADLYPDNGCMKTVGFMFFFAATGMAIQLLTQMNQIAQEKLSVTARNGMIVAEGILHPMDDIFSFIDDIIMVKIGVVIASSDLLGLRKIFFLGTLGGFGCGVIGALIATFIALTPPIRDAVLDPFHATGGCTLTKSDVEETAIYFLLTAWQWPFTFASNAFQGFTIALADFPMFGLVFFARTMLHYTLIITAFRASGSLQLLGGIRLGAAIIGFILWCASTARPGIRKRLGFGNTQSTAGSSSSSSSPKPGFFQDAATRKAVKDGLGAMVCELSVEMARTITLFVTASKIGVAAFYQVSTSFTIQVLAGLAFSEGVFQQMKLQGAKILASGLNYHFVWFWEYCAFCSLTIAVGSFAVTYSSIEGLAFRQGLNACIFASEESCLSEFSNFFGAPRGAVGSTVMQTILTLAPIVMIRTAYRLCRATLYCMQDFVWMAKVSFGCFIVFFLPSVVLLGAFSDSALTAVLVMTIPNLTVLIFFARRVRGHLREIDLGPRQSLNGHAEAELPSASLESQALISQQTSKK